MIIDIHSHLVHPETVRQFPVPPTLGDVEHLLATKAEAGIDLTLVGSPNGAGTMVPVPGGGNYNQPPDKLRAFHDWLGEVVAQHRDQLRAYVYCDPFGDEQVLAAAAEFLRKDEFVGIITNPSSRGEYLDSPRADDFFALAAELDVPVMLHSGAEPACCQGITNYGLIEMVGRYCDVTLGLAAVLLSGRLEQYPTLRVIGTCNGGALSLLTSRLDLAWRPRHWDTASGAPSERSSGLHTIRTNAPPSELMKHLYIDTTGDNPYAHLANIEAVGPDHIMFGSDWPPVPVAHREKVCSIAELPLPEADRQAILSGNALRVFKLGADSADLTAASLHEQLR